MRTITESVGEYLQIQLTRSEAKVRALEVAQQEAVQALEVASQVLESC